jgi:hypothetical protein
MSIHDRFLPKASSAALTQKDMIVSYFAEIKGLVGCVYRLRLAFKVRDSWRFSIEF